VSSFTVVFIAGFIRVWVLSISVRWTGTGVGGGRSIGVDANRKNICQPTIDKDLPCYRSMLLAPSGKGWPRMDVVGSVWGQGGNVLWSIMRLRGVRSMLSHRVVPHASASWIRCRRLKRVVEVAWVDRGGVMGR